MKPQRPRSAASTFLRVMMSVRLGVRIGLRVVKTGFQVVENLLVNVLLGIAFIEGEFESIVPGLQLIRLIGSRPFAILGTKRDQMTVVYVSDKGGAPLDRRTATLFLILAKTQASVPMKVSTAGLHISKTHQHFLGRRLAMTAGDLCKWCQIVLLQFSLLIGQMYWSRCSKTRFCARHCIKGFILAAALCERWEQHHWAVQGPQFKEATARAAPCSSPGRCFQIGNALDWTSTVQWEVFQVAPCVCGEDWQIAAHVEYIFKRNFCCKILHHFKPFGPSADLRYSVSSWAAPAQSGGKRSWSDEQGRCC